VVNGGEHCFIETSVDSVEVTVARNRLAGRVQAFAREGLPGEILTHSLLSRGAHETQR